MKAFRRHSPRCPSQGFSLLEVLLAVTIFSVCLLALYSTFRVSSRAFQTGRKSAEVLQTVRFTVDRVSRDLRGVFFETDYRGRLEALNYDTWAREDVLMQSLDADTRNLLPGLYSTGEDEEEEPTFAGLMMNLHFQAKDDGDTDSVEFAHYLPSDGTTDNSYLGAERIQYYVEGTDLYRKRERVLSVIRVNAQWREELQGVRQARLEERDTFERNPELDYIDFRALARRGTLPEQYQPQNTVEYFQPEPTAQGPPELLAHNVTQFNLRYGYFEGRWQEVDEWDSDDKKHRSPPFNLTLEDPDFNSKLADYQARPDDGLPAYVRLTLTIDPRAEEDRDQAPPGAAKKTGVAAARKASRSRRVRGRARTVETIIWIPASLEGFTPEDAQGRYEPTPEEQ